MLAQRAASEGPRWTRAVEAQSAPIPKEITSELGWTPQTSFDGRMSTNMGTLRREED